MSNIAPHCSRQFEHLLRQDVIFAPPGAHIILKWCKTMQDAKSTHIVQIPEVANIWLCPVRTLRTLLASRQLAPTSPLFANSFYPHSQIIDTHVRDALKTILTSLKISHSGHGFHSFRRSEATLAFDHSVPLQNITASGEVQQYGPICKTQPRPLLSFPPPLLLLYLPPFDGLGVLKFHILKTSLLGQYNACFS